MKKHASLVGAAALLSLFLLSFQHSQNTRDPQIADSQSEQKAKSQNTTSGGSPSANPTKESLAPAETADKNRDPIPADNEVRTIRIGFMPPIAISRDRVDILIVSFTAIIALAAIVQLFFLIRAANAARDAAEAARMNSEALISSERAWIFIEEAEIVSSHRGQRPVWEALPILENHGKTVARVIKISSTMSVLQTTEPVYEHEQTFNFTVYPTGKTKPIRFGIDMENFNAAQSGMLRLWLYGKVEYVDFQERKRESGFCLMYHPVGVGPKPTP